MSRIGASCLETLIINRWSNPYSSKVKLGDIKLLQYEDYTSMCQLGSLGIIKGVKVHCWIKNKTRAIQLYIVRARKAVVRFNQRVGLFGGS